MVLEIDPSSMSIALKDCTRRRIMTIIIESLIIILLFTIIIVSLTLKNPLISVGDYPPAIREKCIELGLIEKREHRLTKRDVIRKAIGLLVFIFIAALLLRHFNNADTFWKGFRDSFLIWLIVDWYDALILDCIWFCHSKKVRIPKTEDMEEYKDYWFHIKRSCMGTVIGLPACIIIGVITAIL